MAQSSNTGQKSKRSNNMKQILIHYKNLPWNFHYHSPTPSSKLRKLTSLAPKTFTVTTDTEKDTIRFFRKCSQTLSTHFQDLFPIFYCY